MPSAAVKRRPPQPHPEGRKKPCVRVGDVTRFGELCTEIDVLDTERKSLRLLFLTAREAGVLIPEGSPFELKFIDQTRRSIDWEQEAQNLAEKLLSAESREKWRFDVIERARVTSITSVKAELKKTAVLESIRA